MTRYLLINGKRFEIDYDASTGNYEIGPEASLPQDAIIAQYPELVDVNKDIYSGSDTNISIEEIYNQLSLTAEQTEIEDVVQSPLSEDNMFSPFSNSVPYCIELASFGEGERALKGYIDLLKNFKSTYEGAVTYKHYVQLYKNSQWRFNGDKYIDDNSTDQLRVLRLARGNTCTAFLAAFGNTQAQSEKDNTISGKVDMKRYLVIAINGNRTDNVDTCYPSEEDIQNAAPIATYTGGLAGGFLSPTDDETVNYLVISGKFICTSSLQHSTPMKDSAVTDNIIDISYDEYGDEIKTYAPDPKAGQIMDYPSLLEYANQGYNTMQSRFWHKTCNLDESKNSDGAYYTTAFYEQNGTVRTTKNAESLYPYNSDWKSLNELEYNYSQNWDNSDKLWKLDLIQCTLKIGDKYCVEIPNADGLPTYRWLRYEDCPVIAGTVQNHIFLGPNPKIGDSFIGVEYDMCNTVDHTMNIDAKGIAIPILADDILSGKVEFTIDGPCNLTYDEITRHHPSFWKHTEWGVKSQQVLGHINQIMISDFEVKIYSNNANINNAEGNEDLIYQSDETLSDFVNRKDDITFKITTNLTSKECKEKGIRNTVKMNTAWLNNAPLRSVYNVYTQNEGKPEEHYLTNYFREYTAPKVLIETELFEDAEHDFISHYAFTNMEGKEFMVQSITKDVKNASDTLLLKEIPTTHIDSPEITQNILTVSMSSGTVGATVYYTIDGSNPDVNDTVYTEPFKLYSNTTIKAVAIKDGVRSAVVSYSFRTYDVKEPVITSYGSTIIITNTDSVNARVYYTLDGSDPDDNDTLYTEPFTLNSNTTVKAVAILSGVKSDTVTYSYVAIDVDEPVITSADITVTITCNDDEASVYYTLDGSDPDDNDTLYTESFTLSEDTVIKAVALKQGVYSDIVSYSYTVPDIVTPVININDNILTITCATPGVTIIYKINNGSYTQYSSAVTLTESCTIITYATKSGYNNSDTATASYTATVATPVITLNGNVATITCDTYAAAIYVKIDDGDWFHLAGNEQSFDTSCTISAYATKSGWYDSAIATATYIAPSVVATPVINFNDNILTITCDTTEATIYYKIDSGSYTQYTSAVTLNDSCQITAYASKSGWNDSDTATRYYTATVATPVVVLDDNILTATCETSGATIRYEIDDSGRILDYTGPVTLSDTCKIVVTAMKTYWNSSTTQVTYVKRPVIRLDNNKVYIDYSGTGITAYYTLDGTDPTTSSTQYSSYFTINKNNDYTIKAITVYKNTSSAVTVYNYISLKAPTITQQYYTLSMSTPTPDASIYYKFDQFAITTDNSYLYTEPFILTENKQYIQAKAYQASTNSWSDSSTLSYYQPYVPAPEVTRSGNTITLTDILGGATLYVEILRNGQYSGFDYTGPFALDYSCTIYPYLHKNVNGNDMWSDDAPYEFVPV